MLNKLTLSLTLAISSLALLLLPKAGIAQTTLTQATVESFQNQVRLIPNQQNPRSARVSDVIRVQDTIATANASRVDLRFNDRSLARLGEQAIFRFLPGTRTADLANGTGLFLINPGQGTTTIRTPNAAAGIRGSAVFVRVIPAEDGQEGTTLIGALTNSGIQTCSQNGSQCVELKAGQMAHFEGENLNAVYLFDLTTFLNTSSLTQDLDQVAPEGVLGEIQSAIASATSLTGTILNTPNFIRMRDNQETEFADSDIPVVDLSFESEISNNELLEDVTSLDLQEMTEVGEIRLNTPFPDGDFPGGGATGGDFPGDDDNNGNNGNFPGGGATGGVFPGGGATGGDFRGGGNN